MSPASLAVLASLVFAPSMGCGDDAPPGMAPDNPVRRRGAGGLEELPPLTANDGGPIDVGPPPVLLCCDVAFAIAADQEDGEVEATLWGSDVPLLGGIELTRNGARWEGSACIPDAFAGNYFYEVGVDIGTDEPFLVRRTNASAPQDSDSNDPTNALHVDFENCGELSVHATVESD